MSKLTESMFVFAIVYPVGQFAVGCGLQGQHWSHALLHAVVSCALLGLITFLSMRHDSMRKK